MDVVKAGGWIAAAILMAGCTASVPGKSSGSGATSTTAAVGPTHLVELEPVDAKSVWAETFAPETRARQILRSDDGGNSWQRVTPSLPGNLEIRTTDFLNDDDAWLVVTAPGEPLPRVAPLWATTDGGEAWDRVGVLPLACYSAAGDIDAIPAVQFVDANDGWCGLNTPGGAAATNLYRTRDGGRSWQDLDGPISLTAVKDRTTGPVAGRFNTPASGWASAACPGQPASDCLYRSDDGGVSWKRVMLPAPPGDLTISAFPIGTGPDLAMGGYDHIRSNARTVFLLSADSGTTWREVVPPGDPRVWAISIPGNADWRLVSQDQVLATDDAGHRWRTIHADRTLTIPENPHAITGPTTYITPTTAWFTPGNEQQQAWKTTDGGLTWTQVTLPGVST